MKKSGIQIAGVAVAMAALSGCGAGYRQFAGTTERQYGVSYDADARSGSLSVTFRPARAGSPHAAPNPVYAMDDATIGRMARLVYEAARRNAPDLTRPVEEIPASFATEGKGVLP